MSISGVCLHTHARRLLCARTRLFFTRMPLVTRSCVCACLCVPGGMPAPEQSPVTEEGLLLTIREGSARHAMQADTTANNILASVKEQVVCFFYSCREEPLTFCPTHCRSVETCYEAVVFRGIYKTLNALSVTHRLYFVICAWSFVLCRFTSHTPSMLSSYNLPC